MQEAFFFGPSGQPIFASYHPPDGGVGEVLTVICPPLFSEYQRTHPALREIALMLAQVGQHVLRFDYRGTGDSLGDLEEYSISDWVDDVAQTVREGKEISGCDAVRLLSVRAGALIACKFMGTSSDVQRSVMWDPVAHGTGYLQGLRQAQADLCRRNQYLDRHERREVVGEYAGHVLSARMVEELDALDANTYARIPTERMRVVTTSPDYGFPIQGVACERAAFRCNWDSLATEMIVPRPVMERLVECLIQP